MSWRKFIFFSLVIIVSLYAKHSFAYETDTHAYLTDEAINFYNRSFSTSSIPNSLKDYILDGARREDDGVRSFNHFYDPVNNIGLRDAFLGIWEKSKDWADDSPNQNNLKYKVPAVIASILSAVESERISDISSETDFTWHKAIEFYANNEKEKAFFMLGHVIHLIEDASVPDHTRNDLHPDDSPYENWTAQFNPQNKDQSLPSRLSNKNPVLLDSLSSYFNGLAAYSNNNFYSKDTIGVENYKAPASDYVKKLDGYYYAFKEDVDTGDYPLFVYKTYPRGLIFSNNDAVTIQLTDEDKVVNGYWSRLSTKAVQYAAGAINLFFKEAEAAKNDPNLIKQNEQKSFIASIADGAQNVVLAVGGAIQKAISALENILKQNNVETNESQTNAPPENSANDTVANIPNQETASESTSAEQIDSELATGEQLKEDVESLPADSETSLTAADREAIAQMLARLDDLMRQAVELKTKIDAAGDGSTSRTIENQVASASNLGGAVSYTSGGSGGGVAQSSRTFPKILISEIQLSSASSTRDEFVELYNPNDSAVDLTEWYLQKKTAGGVSFSTFAPATLFASMTIPARGYFLVAHPSSTFAAGVFTSYGIADNNSLVLKNPDQGIVDKVGWGGANDCEGTCAPNPPDGQSIQRRFVAGVFSDTNQNAADFELQNCPSPKASASTCGVVSTASSTEPVASSTESIVPSSTHILISEIMAGESGAANDEWVELYNPTAQAVSLANWSLKRKATFVATSTTNLVSAASFSGVITPKSFFLIASRNWNGVASPDLRYSQSSNHLAQDEDILLLHDAAGDLVDEVSYLHINFSESLERKAENSGGNCVPALNEGEFLGNGCDTDDASDFEIRSGPKPQNSLSLPEPRMPPTITTSSLVFASSSMSLVFDWSEAADANGATSSIIYEIREIASSTATSSAVLRTTSIVHFSKGIDSEVGRNFNFTLQAVDKDGLGSAASSLGVHIPSFFDRFYFYADPRNPGSNVFDIYYSAYPFIPGTADTWKLILFYINADALKDEHLIGENEFAPSGVSNLISLNYPRCSGPGSDHSDNFLLLPESDHCSALGGGLSSQGFPGLEDFHFIIPIYAPGGSDVITTSTYITAAFYDWELRYGPNAGFRLVAVDRQKYYFQDSAPSSTSPFPPRDLTVQFDDLHSSLNLSWPQSMDPDSLDNTLNYEINYSTSTDFSASTWRSVGRNLSAGMAVVYGNDYKIGVQAVDDFGNVSSPPTSRDWHFPSEFTPKPSQGNASERIGSSDGPGQRIFISSSTVVSRIAMMVGNGGAGSITQAYIGIYEDDNGNRGNLIATSTAVQEGWPQESGPVFSKREDLFNFSFPVNLLSGNFYWFVPTTSAYGLSIIYGSNDDVYPGGYWSGNPGADAYFYIR